jgi:hypothetical protein
MSDFRLYSAPKLPKNFSVQCALIENKVAEMEKERNWFVTIIKII